jgi:YbbR domain-containing protein
MPGMLRQVIIQNIIWFGVSLLLAFMVWYMATLQADPIDRAVYRGVPVLITPDDGLIITSDAISPITVTVRARTSLLRLITREDLIASVDLLGKGVGRHTVPLVVRLNRSGNASLDTQPTQVTVELEQMEARQKSVEIVVTSPSPVEVSNDAPTTDVLQAEVRGAASEVAQVDHVQGQIDLSSQRSPFSVDVPLVAVDLNGVVVPNVTVTPNSAAVFVNIYQRPDVRPLTVRPNILLETLAPGYVFTSLFTNPSVVYLSGSEAVLASLGDTINTKPIDLTERTEDFEVSVSLDLPDENLLVLSGDNNIIVNIGIEPQITVRQFDSIPITFIGEAPNAQYVILPPTISVVLNGPLALLDDLTAADIQAVLDVNGLASGNYDVVPTIVIQQGDIVIENKQLLPAVIALTVTMPTTPAPATLPTTPAGNNG